VKPWVKSNESRGWVLNVSGQPITDYDPYGLFSTADLPVLPDWLVNGATGFGDGVYSAITFGMGDLNDVRNA